MHSPAPGPSPGRGPSATCHAGKQAICADWRLAPRLLAHRDMALFEIRGLRKRVGERWVLDGIDLDVHKGELLTIIGTSGSGKRVLLKHLIGLLQADEGKITFDGTDVTRLSEREWVQVRKRVGMLFQESALFDSLTVEDNVAYGLREHRLLDE